MAAALVIALARVEARATASTVVAVLQVHRLNHTPLESNMLRM